jgi:hypothetical protein
VFEGIKRKLYCVAVAVSCELRGGLGVEVLVEVKGCMGRGILREGRPTMVTTAKHKPFASGLDLQHIDKEISGPHRASKPPHHIKPAIGLRSTVHV